MESARGIPSWLKLAAAANFYDECKIHRSRRCNFFCLQCMCIFCPSCKTQRDHYGHAILTAYKASGEAAFRLEDLKPLWDTSGIYPYSINGKPIAFIHKKRVANHMGNPIGDVECEACQYKIRSPSKVCSVECKVSALLKKIIENADHGSIYRVTSKPPTETHLKRKRGSTDIDASESLLDKIMAPSKVCCESLLDKTVAPSEVCSIERKVNALLNIIENVDNGMVYGVTRKPRTERHCKRRCVSTDNDAHENPVETKITQSFRRKSRKQLAPRRASLF